MADQTPDRAVAAAAQVIEQYLRGTDPWIKMVTGPIHPRWLREMSEAVVSAVDDARVATPAEVREAIRAVSEGERLRDE